MGLSLCKSQSLIQKQDHKVLGSLVMVDLHNGRLQYGCSSWPLSFPHSVQNFEFSMIAGGHSVTSSKKYKESIIMNTFYLLEHTSCHWEKLFFEEDTNSL